MSSIVQALPAGAFTLTGKTSGPAVALGRNRYAKSQLIFMHENELRDANVKMGWRNPESHQELADAHESVKGELAAALEQIAAKDKHIADLEAALGWKPKPKAPAKKAPEKKPKPQSKAKKS